jgi:hypothetical protein
MILYVIKDSTGERFYEGDMVWSLEYQKEIGPIRFDGALTGTKYFDDWYEGYFRTDTGIYHINELSALVQRPVEVDEAETSMLLLG